MPDREFSRFAESLSATMSEAYLAKLSKAGGLMDQDQDTLVAETKAAFLATILTAAQVMK